MVGAAMARVSGGALAAAVTKAGGFGFIGNCACGRCVFVQLRHNRAQWQGYLIEDLARLDDVSDSTKLTLLSCLCAASASQAFLEEQIEIARKELDLPAAQRLPIGAGFLVWTLEDVEDVEVSKDVVRSAARQLEAVWFSFGDDLEKWVKLAREADAHVKVRSATAVAAPKRSYASRLQSLQAPRARQKMPYRGA